MNPICSNIIWSAKSLNLIYRKFSLIVKKKLAPTSGDFFMFINVRKSIVSFLLISVPELKKNSRFALLGLRFLPLHFSP